MSQSVVRADNLCGTSAPPIGTPGTPDPTRPSAPACSPAPPPRAPQRHCVGGLLDARGGGEQTVGAAGLEGDLQPNRRAQRDARRALFERVHALYAAGKTLRDITAATGVGRPTVRQWVRSGRPADRAAV